MGIHEQFIGWVKLLCNNAYVAINLNGSPGENFKIERGVQQGYHLPPTCSWLLVGLAHIIKKAEVEGRL